MTGVKAWQQEFRFRLICALRVCVVEKRWAFCYLSSAFATKERCESWVVREILSSFRYVQMGIRPRSSLVVVPSGFSPRAQATVTKSSRISHDDSRPAKDLCSDVVVRSEPCEHRRRSSSVQCVRFAASPCSFVV